VDSSPATVTVPNWAVSNHQLHLIILPTEGCNFRCVYCYEDFRIGRMKPDVVLGTKRYLSRRMPELKRLSLSWFGGEPLLAVDIVEDVLHHVQQLRSRYPAAAFSSAMTTNAYNLDRDRLENLVALGNTEFQITLDGTAEEHDRKRKRARGGGTFATIWGNLVSMQRSAGGFRTVVRLHVDRGNVEDLGRLLEACAGVFAGDPRFEFMIRPLSRLGGPNDSRLDVLEAREAATAVAGLIRTARELGLRPWVSRAGETICYAARPNSFVIRANGRLAKCTVALTDPRNDVGSIREDGTLALARRPMLPWIRGLWTRDPGTLECPIRGMDRRD
jgi:uncharacterized protein